MPPETIDASWFSNDDGNMLGAIIRDARDLTWRYVIFERRSQDQPYTRVAAGQDIPSFAGARMDMDRDARINLSSHDLPP